MAGDETIESWLTEQIQYAEHADGMMRSYRQDRTATTVRLSTLKEVRDKIAELWGIGSR